MRTTMKINEAMYKYRLPNHATKEQLESCWSNVLKFGDHVLVAGNYYNGPGSPSYFAAVYEYLDDDHDHESILSIKAVSEVEFEDAGKAVEWGMKKTKMNNTTINKNRYFALNSAIDIVFKDSHISLTEVGTGINKDNILYKVNWSAIGDTDPAYTRMFAEDLKMAADMADALNDMGLKLEWKNDDALCSLIERDREAAVERFADYKKLLADQLRQITDFDPSSLEDLYELLTDYHI